MTTMRAATPETAFRLIKMDAYSRHQDLLNLRKRKSARQQA